MGQITPLQRESEQSGSERTVGTGDTMPHQPEDSIIDDILDYLREQESICIQTKRQSGPDWIREHNGEWQCVKRTSGGAVSASILEEGTVKAILKANYYRLIPATQAQSESGEQVWDVVENSE